MLRSLCIVLLVSSLALLCGCTAGTVPSFNLKKLAKSDIDMVIDRHISETNRLAAQLMVKLYKRNPRELRKGPPGMTVEKRLKLLFNTPYTVNFNELNGAYGNRAIPLAFDPNFKGDRVFALMAGIAGMLHTAYNHQTEYFMFDDLDQQKIYHCARNLESIAWQLNSRRAANGELFILANSIDAQSGLSNFSFERLFGKMIAIQDVLAQIISDKNDRAINKVVHGVASTVLLPI